MIDIDGLELNPALRELVGKVRSRRPVHRRVRVGQYTPHVVRLVVDLKQAVLPQQFTLAAGGSLPAPAGLRPVPDRGGDPLLALIREKEAAERAPPERA